MWQSFIPRLREGCREVENQELGLGVKTLGALSQAWLPWRKVGMLGMLGMLEERGLFKKQLQLIAAPGMGGGWKGSLEILHCNPHKDLGGFI